MKKCAGSCTQFMHAAALFPSENRPANLYVVCTWNAFFRTVLAPVAPMAQDMARKAHSTQVPLPHRISCKLLDKTGWDTRLSSQCQGSSVGRAPH